MSDLRYPIGKFVRTDHADAGTRVVAIAAIEEAPRIFSSLVSDLSEDKLDMPYRPEGWTVRQVVHHVCDSHMNAYVRFKLTVTEEEPLVKTYKEKVWAELLDARTLPVGPSLQLLSALHERWVVFLRSLGASDFQKSLTHPDHGKIPLDNLLQLYAWHGRHHAAHISSLRERMGW